MNKMPLRFKLIFLAGIATMSIVISYDVLAATDVPSIIDITSISTLRDISIGGLFLVFLYMNWQSQKSQAKKDELIYSKLTGIVADNAAAMMKLSESISNFQKNCIEIQTGFQREVDRMGRKVDEDLRG